MSSENPVQQALHRKAPIRNVVLGFRKADQAMVWLIVNTDPLLNQRGEVQKIVDAIPAGTAVMCPSNTYMHTAEVAEDFEAYLASLNRRGNPS